MIDRERIQYAIEELLAGLGLDISSNENIQNTPLNVAKFFEEFWTGQNKQIPQEIYEIINVSELSNQIIVQKDVSFYSICEHHLLPFRGVLHIGYVPNKEGCILGLGRIPKLVRHYSNRLQLQERLTNDIAQGLYSVLNPEGVIVVSEAQHDCMLIRGSKHHAVIKTVSKLGCFEVDSNKVQEFYSLIQ